MPRTWSGSPTRVKDYLPWAITGYLPGYVLTESRKEPVWNPGTPIWNVGTPKSVLASLPNVCPLLPFLNLHIILPVKNTFILGILSRWFLPHLLHCLSLPLFIPALFNSECWTCQFSPHGDSNKERQLWKTYITNWREERSF